jgi:PAS domain-containing protein
MEMGVLSDEQCQKIVERMPELVMITKPDGRISYLSNACRNILG